MSDPRFDPTGNLERFRSAIASASSAVNESGVLTEPLYADVAIWFSNVDVMKAAPPSLPQISDAERTTLVGSVLGDMLIAIRDVVSRGLSEFDAFEHLTPILDALWCELFFLRPLDGATF